MLRYYSSHLKEWSCSEKIPDDFSTVLWIDMEHPSREEELSLEALVELDIPTRQEMDEIEVSSRLYSRSNARYLTVSIVVQDPQQEYVTHSLTFILKDTLLITLRYFEIPSFNKFIARQKRGQFNSLKSGVDVFSGLIESMIDNMSDYLEMVGHELDTISKTVFKPKELNTPSNLQTLLTNIGHYGDLTGKMRESLLSLTRALNFLILSSTDHKKQHIEAIETCAKDLISLTEHEGYLTSRINLLLNATMGMINIEQNAIIKIFSVAAVVFMPPTLIASIYGMNFHRMPELSWSYGYPFAVVLMIISAILPYYFFKRKHWL
jgi:magnesium transporter